MQMETNALTDRPFTATLRLFYIGPDHADRAWSGVLELPLDSDVRLAEEDRMKVHFDGRHDV